MTDEPMLADMMTPSPLTVEERETRGAVCRWLPQSCSACHVIYVPRTEERAADGRCERCAGLDRSTRQAQNTAHVRDPWLTRIGGRREAG